MRPPSFLLRLSSREYRALTLPVVFTISVLIILFAFFEFKNYPEHPFLSLVASFFVLLQLAVFLIVLVPNLRDKSWFYWLAAFTNGVMIAIFLKFVPHVPMTLRFVLYVICLVAAITLGGKQFTYVLFSIFFITASAIGSLQMISTSEVGLWIVGFILILITVTEVVAQLQRIIDSHFNRLTAIHQITRNITSTLELDELFRLLNDAFHKSIPADTHFLGLVQGEKLHVDWFFDEGEYFPAIDVPLQGSLSAWIAQNNRSLLVRNLPKEGSKYGMDHTTIGKNKLSSSWIGSPLRSGDKVIGIIALASYSKSAFKAEDLNVLETIAQQASLVIENAYHHAEAVEQSHRDSLTHVFNHGYFIERLQDFLTQPATTRKPASLIMLDVDYFKPFNDTHGHQAGDQALIKITDCIRQTVRDTDYIGRWGGEEFVILLPGSKGREAYRAADRILKALSCTMVPTRENAPLALPTASMGIAVYPTEARDINELIHLADRRLYQAKSRGRNQIEPEKAYWMNGSSAKTSEKPLTVSVTESSSIQ
jgi:diguanylate cyclase (GGDEF)-like protein